MHKTVNVFQDGSGKFDKVEGQMDDTVFQRAKEHFVVGLEALEKQAYAQAAVAFEQSLTYIPERASTLINLQAVYVKLKRLDEAWDLTERILRLEPSSPEAYLNAGNVLKERFEWSGAREYFDKAIALSPRYESAWNNRGALFLQNRMFAEAEHDFKRALELNPNNDEIHNNLGNLYLSLKNYKKAEESYKNALRISRSGHALFNLGSLYAAEHKDFDRAISCFEEAVQSTYSIDWLAGAYLASKARVCDWNGFSALRDGVREGVETNRASIIPFDALCFFASPQLLKRSAELYVERKCVQSKYTKTRYEHKKIRIGYLSSDFSDHAVSHLMAGVFRCHDSELFEMHGFDIGFDDESNVRRRVVGSFFKFHSISSMTDQEASDLIRQQEIDILIDLNGHSRWARTELLARKPAPIQVNYLGFPGTMGAPAFMDYIIADEVLIPPDCQNQYSEKIIYLPDSFQANDSERAIGGNRGRASFGLDDSCFVFGCFSHSGKLNPETFGVWASILKGVPDSVLWLINENPRQVDNLRSFVANLGVDLDRLVFTDPLPYSEHLARYQLIDLVLDTMPFNGGTTTSDALWGGAPVLTCIGECFSGRMSASLLSAINLPELITHSVQEYEERAIELAMNRESLGKIRQKLANNRLVTPLFDTERFTKNLEAAYRAVWSRHQAGMAPDHIFV